MRTSLLGGTARYLLLTAVALLALGPLWVMISGAFKTQAEFLSSPWGIPSSFSLGGFGRAWSEDFGIWFGNTVLVSVVSVLVSVFLAALAAWGFAHWAFRGRDVLLGAIVSLMVVPPVVMLVPLFQAGSSLGWISTYQLLIVVYVGLMLPFSVFMLTGFFSALPVSIVEAAKVDGSSAWGIFTRMVLPLSSAPLATLAVVNLLWVWNELMLALVLMQDSDRRTLMVGLTGFQSRYSLDVPTVMAGMLTATAPLVLAYVAGQRYFIQGLTAGAVKGE